MKKFLSAILLLVLLCPLTARAVPVYFKDPQYSFQLLRALGGAAGGAAEAYLRASNYYRTAEFFLHTNPRDPRIMSSWKKSKELFLKSVAALTGPKKSFTTPMPGRRWVFANGMWTFGAKSPSELIKATRAYRLADVVDKIKCKMLVVDSAGDKDMPGQAIKLYRALKGPKEYMLFTAEEGAEEHCQMGAGFISSERILGWLDKNLR